MATNSFYKQTEAVKKWLNSDGANLLKQVKEWYPKETYNEVYKLFSDANAATSTDKIKKFQAFENKLNSLMFNDAENKYKKYQEWRKKNPDTKLIKEDEDRVKNMEKALNFKRGMPSKEKNYETVSIDGDTNKYNYDDMKYLAGQYGFDYDDKNDRSEFLSALAKYQKQKNIDEIMDESTLVNFGLPVAKEYAKQHLDELEGDFSDWSGGVPSYGALVRNPKLGVATTADMLTNAAMFGMKDAAKEPLKKAMNKAYNYGAAPLIRETGNVVVDNKDAGQGAVDAAAGVVSNVVTPRLIHMPFTAVGRGWNYAEGGADKGKQAAINETADKVNAIRKRMMNGSVSRIDLEGLNIKEQELLDRLNALLKEKAKPNDPYSKRLYSYIDKGKVKTLTSDQVKKLKRGEKVEGVPENVNIDDVISNDEMQFVLENSKLARVDKLKNLFKSDNKALLNADRDEVLDKIVSEGKEVSEYTPIEYATVYGTPETRANQLSRMAKNFGEDNEKVKNYYVNAVGKPEYGGRAVAGIYNSLVEPLGAEKMTYKYGGNEKDAKRNMNELALYLANFKQYAKEPDIVDKPERPKGYSKETLDALENDIIDKIFKSK